MPHVPKGAGVSGSVNEAFDGWNQVFCEEDNQCELSKVGGVHQGAEPQGRREERRPSSTTLFINSSHQSHRTNIDRTLYFLLVL